MPMVVWSSAIFVFVLLAGLLELQACATLTISESEKKGTRRYAMAASYFVCPMG